MDLSIIKKMNAVKNDRGSYDYQNIEVECIDKVTKNVVWQGSISDAVIWLKREKKINGVLPPSAIFKVASGYYPVLYSYFWKFKYSKHDDKYNIYKSPEAREKFLEQKDMRKQIVMFSKSGDPVQGFNNVFDALVYLKNKGMHPDFRTILNICKKHSENYDVKVAAETAFDHQWQFYEDAIK